MENTNNGKNSELNQSGGSFVDKIAKYKYVIIGIILLIVAGVIAYFMYKKYFNKSKVNKSMKSEKFHQLEDSNEPIEENFEENIDENNSINLEE